MDQLVVALTLYTRPGCHLCHEMKVIVERVVEQLGTPARIEEINIAGDPDLEERYGAEIPVLLVNGRKAAKYRVSEQELTRILISRAG
jgi:thiol-disulfide isomerase/thioredoxin